MTPRIPLFLAAAGLLAGGVWLGRSSSPAPASAAVVAPTSAAPAGAAPDQPSPSSLRPSARSLARSPSLARPPAAPADPGLAADLSDADPRVRRAAVRELAAAPGVEPALLLAASRDPDLQVGVTATEALGKLHGEGAISARDLIARATDHKLDERVRVTALNGLGVVSSPEAAALLGELAARGDLGERRTAAILLAHQEPAAAVPALIALLGDADEYVRSNALESLRARARGRDFGTDAAAWRAWWSARSR
jgi:HEAT repeat protein